ncbi:hypothetical protein [Zobellia galactanivorans]|uniref:Hypothetical lipoprotein n=1 Tax=Zobellia galactanivorans (strain DSM 12802 / CCUG 47099 / CIP 106680 / NCIMB 13871 / Dsij) TaxID=63186 RepID=G0L551_ZOBGA|nr:hypothetical protein [Zobellia galactanivorans]CAZ95955.1 Hypothetical lipoprotein [Zobellia galactanivorans]
MKTKNVVYIALFVLLFVACSKDDAPDQPNTQEETEEELNLDNLTGSWIRIASSLPSNDGMIVEMKDGQGKIVDKAGSTFGVGDIKWKDIKPEDQENYIYEELGSDAAYYSATMELREDDTLRISVGSSGAGNIQKWVREGEYTPIADAGPVETQELSCEIKEETVLKNGPAAVDYIVKCVLDVTAPLTIEPGVVIEFAENAGLGIYNEGTLNAVGTDNEPIVLRGNSDIKGWWRGVHIETQSVNNKLEHVTIEDAGSDYVYCCNQAASLFLKGAKIALKNVHLTNGKEIGLMASTGTQLESYSNITIDTHDSYPAEVNAEVLSDLDGMGSDYSGNDKDFINVTGAAINNPTTWYELNVPYLLPGKVLDVKSGLVIKAGTEIVFNENGGIGMYSDGFLTVDGNADAPVVMRGQSPVKGFWRGLYFETNSLNNKIDYLELSDTGSNYVYCCREKAAILFNSGKASISNSTLSNGKSYGIVAKDGFEFEEYTANTITTHDEPPLFIDPSVVRFLDGSTSSYTGNTKNYILIDGGKIKEETTISATDIPYRLTENKVLDITAALSVLPGVIMEFGSGSGLGVYDSGSFNAVGTAEKNIIFRGVENSVGYWRGIHTETNSINNIIDYAEISNAGSNYVYCCNDKSALYVKSGKMKVQNTLLANSGGCGIYVRAAATLEESNLNYSNNSSGDLCQD